LKEPGQAENKVGRSILRLELTHSMLRHTVKELAAKQRPRIALGPQVPGEVVFDPPARRQILPSDEAKALADRERRDEDRTCLV